MTATDVRWDGIKDAYVADQQLTISPTLRLHQDADPDLDPVTHEVLRYNLWNINEEHGDTIVKVSGSPIAVYAHDFNPSILTEDGEFVYFGPYLQFHAGMLDANVKWTLEQRSENPGIDDGDMFMADDPWVGTPHQQDHALLCPVFYEGKLFCWVANMLHFADVGGSTPGSFCPDADDVFHEPTPMPPIKIVEKGVIRRDIEDMFLRRSRLPELVKLDLRAIISGNNVARRRILQLLERYGPATVKAVMRRIIDDGERKFLERLRHLPDGTWRTVNFLEVARTGDRRTYKSELAVTKKGDTLAFSNEGTDEQSGAINITLATFRGAVLCSINAFLLYDCMYAIGGALRHLRFDMTPGTLTCATHPAACSNGGSIGVHLVIGQAQNSMAKMMSTSPELKDRFVVQGAASQWPGVTCAGLDQRGNPFGGFLLDPMGGALGAFAFRDGVNTGGLWYDPKGFMPNVEQYEYSMPLLYLYRREVPDSGGAGKFRGGNSAEWAFVPHKTEQLVQAASACGCGVPTAHGICGGEPGATNEYTFVEKSNLVQLMADGGLPADVRDLDGDRRNLQPKEVNVVQTGNDAYAIRWTAGAGYGDPLTRDPRLVARDVADGDVTVAAARRRYGVVVTAEGALDEDATAHVRHEMFAERKAQSRPYDFDVEHHDQ